MTPLGSVWAIAKMTLIEARRRKVFTILLLFAVALMSSALFFPSVEMEARLRLIEVWALRASAIFTAIVGLFLAGFSLPQDFESKRIYMIVTKPVSKPFVFLGKYLGYVLLLALFIGTMGVITVVFLRVVKLASGDRFPALAAYPRIQAAEFSFPGGDALEGGQAEAAIGFGPGKALVWTFHPLNPSRFESTVRAQARLIFGAKNDPYRASGSLRYTVRDGAGGEHAGELSMNTNEEAEFTFPGSLIRKDGTVTVEFRCADADGILATRADWVVLYEKSMLFEVAFARGLLLILFQSMIVLSITLMSSTFLSAPLSILLGIMLYMVGSIYGYIREGTRDIDMTLTEIRTTKEKEKKKTVEDLPEGLLWFSSELSKLVLKVTPDFAQFDYSIWLLRDHAVSWKDLSQAGGRALPPIAVLVVLGTLLMAFKDFDR